MTPREYLASSMNGNGGNGDKPKFEVIVRQLRESVSGEQSPQVQYFSSDVRIADTSDGPKVGVHMYGNNDEETVNRAILSYLDTIEKLDGISKQGHKIRLSNK